MRFDTKDANASTKKPVWLGKQWQSHTTSENRKSSSGERESVWATIATKKPRDA